jgi:glycosyltransferase involved in cell wall biosynthesis
VNLARRPSSRPRHNLLLALPYMITGGADTVLVKVAGHLARSGWGIVAVTTVPPDLSMGESANLYREITPDVFHLPLFLPQGDEWKDFLFWLIESRAIDVLFLAGSELVYHLLPEIRRRFPRLRVVDQLFNEIGHLENNRRYAAWIDLNVVATPVVRDSLLGRHRESPHKVRMILHGVDADGDFNPEAIEPAPTDGRSGLNGSFLVSYIGRFSQEKAPHRFLDLAEAMSGFSDTTFLMIGNGPEFESVRARVARRGLADRVVMPSFVDDIRPYLRATDVLVIPSLIEGVPIILLEAMAMGVPVVASRVGGIPDVVRDGETGFLVDPYDPKTLVERVTQLHTDPDLHRRISEAARTYALRHCGVAEMLRAYEEALESLADAP